MPIPDIPQLWSRVRFLGESGLDPRSHFTRRAAAPSALTFSARESARSLADRHCEATMMRVRLKADGRIVEILPDGSEKTVDHSDPAQFVRQVRARCGLTQAAFAEKIEVPIETVRNWEQGKRSPRGPARALLKLIDTSPDAAFAALGGRRR
jgi:putative transcriptional regulator